MTATYLDVTQEAGMGHRKAALLDSRLLPMIESKDGSLPWIEGLGENSG